MSQTALARAKINLCLHVGAPRPDGYHPIASLVAFANVGDLISVERADRLSLNVTGPFGADLAATSDNLILRALQALGRAVGMDDPPVAVVLDKRLPIAAGLGGGSSDAATAMKMVRDLLALEIDDAGMARVAECIGADGPMCLAARTAWAEGIGERLTPVADIAPLAAVLVNPGVPSPTKAVYAAYDLAVTGTAARPALPEDRGPSNLTAWLTACRNDLEEPARALAPEITVALAALSAMEGSRLSRMSGSGATVFGLFDDMASAEVAANRLSAAHVDWWVSPCLLGDSVTPRFQ